MVNFFLPCPELTSGNEHILFEHTKCNCTQPSYYSVKYFKINKYFGLKTHSCLCRVRDANKVVVKKSDIC